jgi:hypothetical protein
MGKLSGAEPLVSLLGIDTDKGLFIKDVLFFRISHHVFFGLPLPPSKRDVFYEQIPKLSKDV